MIKSQKALIYAVISGLIGVVLISIYVSGTEKRIREKNGWDYARRLTVVIAADVIPADTTITEDMVTIKEIAQKSVRGMAFTSMEEVIGQVAKEKILKGAQVLASQVKKSGDTLAGKIPAAGLRALSLPVIGVNGISGLIIPGNYVDIIGTFKNYMSHSQESTITTTLLQNVQVLAVGQNINERVSSEISSSVTVAVTPEEAEVLTLAINGGAVIALALRPPNDNEIVTTGKKSLENLSVIKEGLNEQRQRRMKTVEVFRSTERKTEEVR